MPFTLPPLPYPTNALEPHIDAQTTVIAAIMSGEPAPIAALATSHPAVEHVLRRCLEKAPELQGKSLDDLLKNLNAVPESVRTAVRNNGGGHWNHSMFWQIMAPNAGGAPSGKLADAIKSSFGDFEKFKEQFNAAGAARFGSGWAWLVNDGGKLSVVSTPNQDNPIMDGKPAPILGIDVWEHAYYLKYQNRRPDYMKAWWNVVNWAEVAKRFG